MMDFLHFTLSSKRRENLASLLILEIFLPESGLLDSLRENKVDWFMNFVPKIIAETSWIPCTLSTSTSFNQKSFGLGNIIAYILELLNVR